MESQLTGIAQCPEARYGMLSKKADLVCTEVDPGQYPMKWLSPTDRQYPPQ